MRIGWGRSFFFGVLLVCGVCASLDAQLLPNGSEFLVNSYTTSSQVGPDITTTTPGNFVVAWTSYGQDGDQWGAFARRYTSPATPLGTEFQVNSYTTGYQGDQRTRIAASPNGDFVVVWDSRYQDGSYDGIYAQRYSSAGTPAGTEFRVNTQTIGYQELPIVGAVSGGFVVVWDDYEPDVEENVFARRYDDNGIPQGTEFQVNTFTTGTGGPNEVIAAAGGFLIAFGGFGHDGDSGGVFARLYDSSGVPRGTEFQVNTYTTGFQGSARAAASADGSFVIVWSGVGSGEGSPISVNGVFGQRFDSSGVPSGSEFHVNTYTTGNQAQPSVSANASGEFVVTWQSVGQDGNGYGIFARAFKADGTPDTPELQVNEFAGGHQIEPVVASMDERSVVFVWQSQLQDGALNGIYGRRFRRVGDRISGKKLYIKTAAAEPIWNTLTFVSADPQFQVPQDAVEDPRCPPVGSGSLSSGAKLRVVGQGGDFTIDLPCVNWSANATGTRYRYRDGSGTTCNAIVLRSGRLLKAICKGTQINYNLGVAQGDVHVTLTTGDPATNRKYCATFGPQSSATVVRDGSDGRSYRAVHAGTGVCP